MVLITGVTGFVGKAVAQGVLEAGQQVVAAVRQPPRQVPLQHPNLRLQVLGNIDGHTQWQLTLREVDTVVHCAACAQVSREFLGDPLAAYREVNVAGTMNLAQQAATAGVRRFVFISSIKVNGEATQLGRPFTEQCAPKPKDAYGQSKAEAEHALLSLAAQSGMEVVIIRPPLVYGPGVKGNFAEMVTSVCRGMPLPLGAVRNRRSRRFG